MLNKNIDSNNNLEYLISIDKFIEALQDERKSNQKLELNTLVFKNIEKFTKKYMKHLKEKNVKFLPRNGTREFRNIQDIIVKLIFLLVLI